MKRQLNRIASGQKSNENDTWAKNGKLKHCCQCYYMVKLEKKHSHWKGHEKAHETNAPEHNKLH